MDTKPIIESLILLEREEFPFEAFVNLNESFLSKTKPIIFALDNGDTVLWSSLDFDINKSPTRALFIRKTSSNKGKSIVCLYQKESEHIEVFESDHETNSVVRKVFEATENVWDLPYALVSFLSLKG